MSVLDQLSSAQNRRDTLPNKELAALLAESGDSKAIAELVNNLSNKKIQSDCIKVLYELGERKPDLIAGFAKEFIALLDSKNNRMVWGAMCAIDTIALKNADLVYNALPKILEAANAGTVITKDHTIGILVQLGSVKKYHDDILPLLLEQLQMGLPNQFPTYAEKINLLISQSYRSEFIKILRDRMPDIETETKRKRVEKLLKKLG